MRSSALFGKQRDLRLAVATTFRPLGKSLREEKLPDQGASKFKWRRSRDVRVFAARIREACGLAPSAENCPLGSFPLAGSNPSTTPDNEKRPRLRALAFKWRRSRDSNPRCPCGAYSLSRRAPSASRSLLRVMLYLTRPLGVSQRINRRLW